MLGVEFNFISDRSVVDYLVYILMSDISEYESMESVGQIIKEKLHTSQYRAATINKSDTKTTVGEVSFLWRKIWKFWNLCF